MSAPIPVNLAQHDPAWADLARREGDRLIAAIGDAILMVHHIGSTAIPGIRAKPILDLIPVVRSLVDFDNSRQAVERLGYAWRGEYGLPGRRYCTFDDPRTGRRTVQLHCFEQGSPQITRHLVFRDHLRSHPDLAREYDTEKARCRDCHPFDLNAYCDCKEAWIRRVEAEALSVRARNDQT